jgi:subtilase family serine protease
MKASLEKNMRLATMLAATIALLSPGSAHGNERTRLSAHVPLKQITQARHLGRLAPNSMVNLAFPLKLRDPAGLAELVKRIYDPSEPDYGRFLTAAEFKERFAPTDTQVNEVISFLRARGFQKVTLHVNNLVIDAAAEASVVERAFRLELHEYLSAQGQRARAPTQNPELPTGLAMRIHGIAGLNSFRHSHPHLARRNGALNPQKADGSGSMNAYMTPAKIKSAYNLSKSPTAGAGETVALFELDGFRDSDLATYDNAFAIQPPTVSTVLVDGVSANPGENADEVTLDVELVSAVAPGATILVYEGPNTDNGVLDTYNRIATDNAAKIVSTSWGASESSDTQGFLDAENAIFQQMAAQGQSVFSASGDSGAYDDASNSSLLAVDDPASQPYVTAVGGTTLSLAAGSYGDETSWGNLSNAQGAGGGFSAVWSLPSWQSGLATVANQGSKSRRMVPDVALNANPAKGYSIYVSGAWYAIGGTSAAAPLWAAFAAQVNQARIAANLSRLGFASPALYQIAQSSLFANCFHDVADGSTNLYFPATSGYDLSTGLGSPQGAALLAALSSATTPPSPPANVATSGAAGTVTVSWSSVAGATSYTVYRSASFQGPFVSRGAQTSTSFSELVGAASFYYYVTATNSAASSAPSAKRAGAAPLAAPGKASSLSSAGGQ